MRWLMLALVACGTSPSVEVTAANYGELPQPKGFEEVVSGKISRSISSCYKQAALDVTGTTVLTAKGSHGILDVEVATGSGNDQLDGCAKKAFSDQMFVRQIADGDLIVGFELTVAFLQK
jgi:hypothetical protein